MAMPEKREKETSPMNKKDLAELKKHFLPADDLMVIKKSSDLSTAVITALKDMTNHSGKTPFGQVQFLDLDQQM